MQDDHCHFVARQSLFSTPPLLFLDNEAPFLDVLDNINKFSKQRRIAFGYTMGVNRRRY